MKVSNVSQTALLSTEAVGVAFSLDDKSGPFLMNLLRDRLYSDKVLAVVREYMANAWDAHVAAGITDRPIEVHVQPGLFVVRDFGHAISEEQMHEVFVRFGASTKRGDNTEVGGFGIGAKAGHAYADQFTLVSRCGGQAKTYVAALGEDRAGTLYKVDERLLAEGEENGFEVRVPITIGDEPLFRERAQQVSRFFPCTPVGIKKDSNAPRLLFSSPSGRVFCARGVMRVLQGPLAYEVSVSALRTWNDLKMYCLSREDFHFMGDEIRMMWARLQFEHDMTSAYARFVSEEIVLALPLGSISLTPSRESVESTEQNTAVIVYAFCSLLLHLTQEVVSLINTKTPWEIYLLARAEEIEDPRNLFRHAGFYSKFVLPSVPTRKGHGTITLDSGLDENGVLVRAPTVGKLGINRLSRLVWRSALLSAKRSEHEALRLVLYSSAMPKKRQKNKYDVWIDVSVYVPTYDVFPAGTLPKSTREVQLDASTLRTLTDRFNFIGLAYNEDKSTEMTRAARYTRGIPFVLAEELPAAAVSPRKPAAPKVEKPKKTRPLPGFAYFHYTENATAGFDHVYGDARVEKTPEDVMRYLGTVELNQFKQEETESIVLTLGLTRSSRALTFVRAARTRLGLPTRTVAFAPGSAEFDTDGIHLRHLLKNEETRRGFLRVRALVAAFATLAHEKLVAQHWSQADLSFESSNLTARKVDSRFASLFHVFKVPWVQRICAQEHLGVKEQSAQFALARAYAAREEGPNARALYALLDFALTVLRRNERTDPFYRAFLRDWIRAHDVELSYLATRGSAEALLWEK